MSFWRRSRGRHALGAAVTSIPAASHTFLPTTGASPPQPPLDVVGQSAPVVPAAVAWSFPELHPAQEAIPPGPRVELTFRDGTSAALDGTQARALDEIARALTRRD
ncbi:MAG: hypothetical protein JWO88_1096 [Frankiales bacterium]|nr:hypothetical protein [Frankiales bacterium]